MAIRRNNRSITAALDYLATLSALTTAQSHQVSFSFTHHGRRSLFLPNSTTMQYAGYPCAKHAYAPRVPNRRCQGKGVQLFRVQNIRLFSLSLLLIFGAACAPGPEVQSTTGATTVAVATIPIRPTSTAISAPTEAAPAPTTGETATLVPSPTAEPLATATSTPDPTPEPTEVALEPFDVALAAELQRILDGTVADGYIPGAVLAVTISGQQPWSGASGLADPGEGQLIEPATRMRIASISKVFTAVVVLQLVEQGLLQLDAPITTWLPDLLPAGNTITVRQLLNHTSGLYDYLEDRTIRNQAYQNPERAWAPAELVAYAARFPPSFPPGAPGQFDYSSTNYVILGMLVEQVTGHSLAQEMRQRIFDPLELTETFFAPDEPVQGMQSRAHAAADDLTVAPMSFAFGTANLVSTVDNVQRFGQALFTGQLLQPETMDMMFTFVNGKGSYNMPALEYGLGVMRNRLLVGPGPDGQPRAAEIRTVVGHTGGFAGFRSVLWWAPESGITIALGLNQSDTDPNILATAAFDAILTHQGR